MSREITALSTPPSTAPSRSEDARTVSMPRVDILEKSDGYVLVADMPGVPEKSLEIQLDGDRLMIFGEVSDDRVHGSELTYGEFRPGAYRRTFAISAEIDREKINASLAHGVLRLSLPRKAALQPRRIDVTSR